MVKDIFKDEVLMSQVIREAALKSLPSFLGASSVEEFSAAAFEIARAFGDYDVFDVLVQERSLTRDDADRKLIASFQKNVRLLVQKTWVEKADEEVKDESLYQIDRLCNYLLSTDREIIYGSVLFDFLQVLKDVVYLLFGSLISSDSFLEYAVRIDPDFGLFWYYIDEVSNYDITSEGKARLAILLGMFFLANF